MTAPKPISKLVSLDKLNPAEYNPRTISTEDMESLKRSIQKFGFVENIVANKDGTIISGHQRYEAAKQLGEESVPVYYVDLNKDDEIALNIAMNRISGEFDMSKLPELILNLPDAIKPFTGFSEKEISAMLDATILEEVKEDEAPPVPTEAKTKLGDLYQLGNHRLLCGDSTSIDAVEKLMNGEKADMVFTDPPYGISIVKNGQVGGNSQEYRPVLGDESIQAAVDSYNLCVSLKIPVLIFWGGNHYCSALAPSSCWIIWDKNNGGTNFADAELAWTNIDSAVRIFKHTWNGVVRESESDEKRVHPTQKPIALAAWCFDKYGKKGDKVLDLFGGSGSTLIACEQLKRKCYMIELDPKYCDVIVARWEKLTGLQATLLPHE